MIDLNSVFPWWLKPVVIGILSLFFLLLGLDTLRFAYTLKNPFEFLMCFFASNLIILISAVGCFYGIVVLRTRIREKRLVQ